MLWWWQQPKVGAPPQRFAVQSAQRRAVLVVIGVIVQAALVLAWLIGWPLRWTFYSAGPATDVQYYTNWNWTLTGSFFTLALLTLLFLPRLDSALHLACFPLLVFSNVFTFVGGTLVVADNPSLMFSSSTAWLVVFVGERFVHVLVAVWVLVYAGARANDFTWIWQGHAYAALREWGPTGGAAGIVALLTLQVATAAAPLVVYSALYNYWDTYAATTRSLVLSLVFGALATLAFLVYVMVRRPRGGMLLPLLPSPHTEDAATATVVVPPPQRRLCGWFAPVPTNVFSGRPLVLPAECVLDDCSVADAHAPLHACSVRASAAPSVLALLQSGGHYMTLHADAHTHRQRLV